MRKLVFYPNVQSFLEDDLQQYSNLKVQYHYGSPPKLILLDEDGNNKETIRYTMHIFKLIFLHKVLYLYSRVFFSFIYYFSRCVR